MPSLEPSDQHLTRRRVERQHALIELLRARGPRPVPAARAAEELGVATRTIERDVARLRDAGVPLRVRTGSGGGLAFDTVATPEPVSLSAAEIGALLVALTAAGPWASAAAVSARSKLVAALAPGGGPVAR